MADVFSPPDDFGGYTDVAGVIAQATQDEIKANFDKLSNLFPDPTDEFGLGERNTGASPDFDMIPPETARKLQFELNALWAAIDAAPTA